MKRIAAILAVSASIVTVAACSSPDDTSTSSTSATASTTTHTSATAEPASILDTLAAAGATCEPGQRGEQECTLDGIKITVAEDGWTRQATDRTRACDAGYINKDFMLLSNGEWTIATDYHDDLETIRAALARQGVDGDLRPYCGE